MTSAPNLELRSILVRLTSTFPLATTYLLYLLATELARTAVTLQTNYAIRTMFSLRSDDGLSTLNARAFVPSGGVFLLVLAFLALGAAVATVNRAELTARGHAINIVLSLVAALAVLYPLAVTFLPKVVGLQGQTFFSLVWTLGEIAILAAAGFAAIDEARAEFGGEASRYWKLSGVVPIAATIGTICASIWLHSFSAAIYGTAYAIETWRFQDQPADPGPVVEIVSYVFNALGLLLALWIGWKLASLPVSARAKSALAVLLVASIAISAIPLLNVFIPMPSALFGNYLEIGKLQIATTLLKYLTPVACLVFLALECSKFDGMRHSDPLGHE